VLGWTLYARFFTHSAPQGWTSLLVAELFETPRVELPVDEAALNAAP
jgi:hypothetical protein